MVQSAGSKENSIVGGSWKACLIHVSVWLFHLNVWYIHSFTCSLQNSTATHKYLMPHFAIIKKIVPGIHTSPKSVTLQQLEVINGRRSVNITIHERTVYINTFQITVLYYVLNYIQGTCVVLTFVQMCVVVNVNSSYKQSYNKKGKVLEHTFCYLIQITIYEQHLSV